MLGNNDKPVSTRKIPTFYSGVDEFRSDLKVASGEQKLPKSTDVSIMGIMRIQPFVLGHMTQADVDQHLRIAVNKKKAVTTS